MEHFDHSRDDLQGRFRDLQPVVEACNHQGTYIFAWLCMEIAVRVCEDLSRISLSAVRGTANLLVFGGPGIGKGVLVHDC